MTGRTLYGMPWRGNKQTKAEKELESSDLEPVPLSSIRILESGSPGLRLLDQVLLHFSASRKFTAASGTLSRFLLFAVPPFCCLFAAAENFISWRIFHRILGCMRGRRREKQLLSRMPLRCGNRNRLFFAWQKSIAVSRKYLRSLLWTFYAMINCHPC